MKKLVKSMLLLVFLLALTAAPAFAGQDTYPYLTFEDSADFTVVAPQISYEVIRAVGLDASFVKHDISDPENITWSTTDQNVAFIIPDDDTVYVVCLDERRGHGDGLLHLRRQHSDHLPLQRGGGEENRSLHRSGRC